MKLAILMPALLLASCGDAGKTIAYNEADARDGAEFRHVAGQVLMRLDQTCPYSTEPDLTGLYDAPNSRFANLVFRLDGSARGMDLAIAQADYDYRMSQMVLECAMPDQINAEDSIRSQVDQAMELVIRLETLAAHMTAGEAG
ncbi:hypothetical protein [Qipengyuania sphaerica]|uniref:hypothetical protein n=1 Tax=Qipengyuania sphaerica TaxID=2867243 RepID=UPI001C8734E3|nr:hypothetical protein [Qipengyuania sphaerica]MBX7541074.1 hypothetical protein [Qipengyuania sphaerica]